MESPRPLHAVFDDLAAGQHSGDPTDALRAAGHGELPDDLLSDAIAHYADTADAAVAEHLAPFVTDPGPALDGLNLLASAPGPDIDDDVFAAAEAARAEEVGGVGDGVDGLDFGTGDLAADPTADTLADGAGLAAEPEAGMVETAFEGGVAERGEPEATLPEAFEFGADGPDADVSEVDG